MREIRPSGSEGGVAPTRHPYPYHVHRSGLVLYSLDLRRQGSAMTWKNFDLSATGGSTIS